ncbi:MAG: hypothetical protein JO347_01365, partial [Candidatus Eremiobacteraeota bacterium]|nr:hypothetical protein [Candidatus Eremiobacteraeota bacterium]
MYRLFIAAVIASFALTACAHSPVLPAAPGQPQSNAPAASAAFHSSGSLTEFDAPGATTVDSPVCDNQFTGPGCGTLAYGINDEGTIVGYYTDAN